GDGCGRADAVHAGDQIEPVGEIAMLANGGDQLLEFALQQSLEPIDLLLPECADTRVAAGLSAGLELRDILGELLDHRQMLGQRRQRASVGSWMSVAAAVQRAIRTASMLSF